MRNSWKEAGDFWADKLMDLANLAIAVLVFGQFGPKIYWIAVIFGVILYFILIIISKKLKGGGKK